MTKPADNRARHRQEFADGSERLDGAMATGLGQYEARAPGGGEFDIAIERGQEEAGVRVSGQGGIRSAQGVQSVLRRLVREGALSIVLDLRALGHVAAVAVAGVVIGFSRRRRCESVFTLVLPDEGTREVLTGCCRGGNVRLRVSPNSPASAVRSCAQPGGVPGEKC